jgi:hypothetical protein
MSSSTDTSRRLEKVMLKVGVLRDDSLDDGEACEDELILMRACGRGGAGPSKTSVAMRKERCSRAWMNDGDVGLWLSKGVGQRSDPEDGGVKSVSAADSAPVSREGQSAGADSGCVAAILTVLVEEY